MMLRSIERRTHNDFAMQAGLHGIKIPFHSNTELLAEEAALEDLDFDSKHVEQAMKEAQERVRARYG